MTAFPKAKVVLTVRDPSRWHISVRDSIYQWKVRVLDKLLPRTFLQLIGHGRAIEVAMKVSMAKPRGFKHSKLERSPDFFKGLTP